VHEAIQHLETNEHPPGTVTNEIQGGYIVQKRLIRPALVVVAKAKAPSEDQGPSETKDSRGPEQPSDEGTITFDEPEIVDDADGENNRD
jgi:molecular chaperone GrpE